MYNYGEVSAVQIWAPGSMQDMKLVDIVAGKQTKPNSRNLEKMKTERAGVV